MIGPTGIWSQEIANKGHMFCYDLARWIRDNIYPHEHINDLGCGKGTYLEYLQSQGFTSLHGYEGSSLEKTDYPINCGVDLSKRLDVEWKGNLICLEVIEHIPSEFEDVIFDNICYNVGKSCKAIISCAIPGQGGDGHVNCQNNLWVIENMKQRGLYLNVDLSVSARACITEERFNYFKETLLVFER